MCKDPDGACVLLTMLCKNFAGISLLLCLLCEGAHLQQPVAEVQIPVGSAAAEGA